MNGIDKVAILLAVLGPEASSRILQNMNQQLISKIMMAMSKLREIDKETKHATLKEFYAMFNLAKDYTYMGEEYIEEILQRAVGRQKAANIVNAIFRANSFDFLKSSNSKSLASILKSESSQTAAVVMSQLDGKRAAETLSQLPEKAQAEVCQRLATLQEVPMETLKQVAQVLESQLGRASAPDDEGGGSGRLAEILSLTSRAVNKSVIDNLKKIDMQLAENVISRMFIFDNVVDLPDEVVQKMLRKVDQRILGRALKGANQEVSERIYKNMTEEASSALMEDIEGMGALQLEEIESAQQQVVEALKDMAAAGEVPGGLKAKKKEEAAA